MERFAVARPDAGLSGTAIAWWHRMKELAGETRVTFGGREGRVEVGTLGLGGLSLRILALDLLGRGIHMCGDSRHLLGVLKKELGMTHFDIFGYLVLPKAAAEAPQRCGRRRGSAARPSPPAAATGPPERGMACFARRQ
jgi:hypothetical protein